MQGRSPGLGCGAAAITFLAVYLSWRTIPLLRAAAALALGILAASATPQPPLTYLAIPVALAAAGLALPVRLAHRATVRGGATLLLLAVVGYVHMRASATRLSPPLPPHDFFLAELREAPRGKGEWLGADARLYRITRDGRDSTVETHVRLMFRRLAVEAPTDTPTRARRALLPGAILISDARLDTVSPPRNPHAFDYADFLRDRGVRQQAWLRGGDYHVVAPAPPPGSLASVRSYIAARIDGGLWSAREAGVAKALLLGDKSGIDETTRLAYTATGAVHVLAVSGLHTGVISFLLVWLLQRALGRRYLAAQFALLLLGLLAYVALTGYSPSVIRASVMFAIIFAGRLWRQDAQGLNNLGAAALVTLIYDPSLLLTLGFQLSYLAVAGIMLFYRPLRRHLMIPYWHFPRLSELAAVSVAATVGTAPLTIYYFHQFPVYFALSGLVAVPLVSLALPLLLATVALDGLVGLVGLPTTWLYYPVGGVLWACNAFLSWLSTLPYVLIEGLYPSPLVATLALLTVVLFGILVTNRRRGMYLACVVAVVATTVVHAVETLGRRGVDETIVYSLRGASIVDVRRTGYTLVADDGRVDPKRLDREVKPHRYALGFGAGQHGALAPVYTDSALVFYEVGETRWAELRDPTLALPPMSWSLDWVTLAEPKGVDPAELAVAFPNARLLLGRRPPPWEREDWAPYADRVHYLSEGAYVHRPNQDPPASD